MKLQIPRDTTNRVAAWLVVLSGVVALAGFLSGWARVLYPSLGGAVREAVGHVLAELLLGLFLIVAGGVALVARSPEVKKAWLGVGIACGVSLGALAIFDLITLRQHTIDHLVRISATGGGDPGQVGRLILFSFRPGIFAALVSGALALAAAVLLFLESTRRNPPEARDPVAPDGSGRA